MFQFIHAADLHIDSPLTGLERYPGAPVDQIRSATRRAFDNMVEFALDSNVSLILISGDLYDGDWPDYNTGLYFVERMHRLNSADIPVCIISGNHDAQSRITKQLRLPGNVAVLRTDKPETVVFEKLNCAVHGQGFATQAVKEDISKDYPDAVPNMINIGMLHTCLDGKPGHANYAPCTLKGLIAKGYDYWALGHVHQREVLHRDPWIVFPGNIQGRHIRESGPKGCTLVTVESSGIHSVEAVALDVFRWQQCRLDIGNYQELEKLYDAIQRQIHVQAQSTEGRPLAVRVAIEGRGNLHTQLQRERQRFESECRALAAALDEPSVWIQKVTVETRAGPDDESRLAQDAAVSDLLSFIASLKETGQDKVLIEDQLSSLYSKLPPEAKNGDIPDITDPKERDKILQSVSDLLVASLSAEGSD